MRCRSRIRVVHVTIPDRQQSAVGPWTPAPAGTGNFRSTDCPHQPSWIPGKARATGWGRALRSGCPWLIQSRPVRLNSLAASVRNRAASCIDGCTSAAIFPDRDCGHDRFPRHAGGGRLRLALPPALSLALPAALDVLRRRCDAFGHGGKNPAVKRKNGQPVQPPGQTVREKYGALSVAASRVCGLNR